MPEFSGQKITLTTYYGSRLNFVEEIELTSGGSANTNSPQHEGIYAIILPDSTNIEFMITEPGPYAISVKDENYELKSNTSSAAFHTFYLRAREISDQIDSLKGEIGRKGNLQSSPENARIKLLRSDMDSLTNKLARENAGNLAGDYFRALLPVTIPDNKFDGSKSFKAQLAYYRNHYLDNINWENKNLIYTPVLEEKMVAYIRKIIPQEPETVKQAIDFLFSKALHQEQKQFIAINILETANKDMSDPLMELAFYHLVSEYYLKHEIIPSSPEQKLELHLKLNTIQSSLIGNEAPEFSLESAKGKIIHLNDVHADATILMFWNYSCPSCSLILDEFKRVVDQYHQSSIEVITIFTGDDRDIWVAWVARRLNPNWKNTIIADNQEVIQLYNITHTPSILVLDEAHRIQSKYITVKQLEGILSSLPENQEIR